MERHQGCKVGWLKLHRMESWILFVILAAGTVFPSRVAAQSGEPAITAPGPGDALQGLVSITGTSDIEGFLMANLDFAYTDDPTGSWFPIAENRQATWHGLLATWDTTTITDGVYDVRLRVTLIDQSYKEVIVPDLRVRNYTPIETPTPTPFIPAATPLPTITPTATPYPTPTRLPSNPAVLTATDVSSSVICGGLGGALLIVLFGFYLWVRRKQT